MNTVRAVEMAEENASSIPTSIALAGLPNSGKTSLFNHLTGLHYKVGNYPGVTVDKKVGSLQISEETQTRLIDCPGIYSLGEFSDDERVSTQLLLGTLKQELQVDQIIYTLDCTNLEKGLFFLSQILELGLPTLVILTMCDIAKKDGTIVHTELLERNLKVPILVFESTANFTEKLKNALRATIEPITDQIILPDQLIQAASALGKTYTQSNSAPLRSEQLIGLGLLSGAVQTKDQETEILTQSLRENLLQKGIEPSDTEHIARYDWASKIAEKSSTQKGVQSQTTLLLDKILTHPISGTLIFCTIMAAIFQAVFFGAAGAMDLIDEIVGTLASIPSQYLGEGPLQSLLSDGIITGVGNVVIFVPQIAILFFLLGLLEESGYLARAAYLMDRILRPFGLQGRSFVPLLSSFACAVPGILSARTISSRADRLCTIMVAPLMSCSARLPVYTVLIGAFIPAKERLFGFSLQGIVFLGLYVLGIIAAICISSALRIFFLKGKPSLFLMEMPRIRTPQLKNVIRETFDQSMSFLKAATTVILACTVILWFLASYPKNSDSHSTQLQASYAGQLGKAIEPVIEPLGFDWKIGVSILASFAAREVFVSSMATINNLESEDSESSLIRTMTAKYQSGAISLATGMSLLIFYVFACQCMSTLAVVKKETGSWAWVAFMFVYMTSLAYVGSFITYQLLI